MSSKVLLVDDEPDFLDLAKIYLEQEDIDLEVETTSSIEEALKLIKNNNFDCIVSDYQMPDIDGLEFLELIREDRESDIPFILFTGKGREEVAMKALNLGADRYLQKGGDPRSQFGVLAQAIIQEVEDWKRQKETKQIEWLIKKEVDKVTYEPPYGDLSNLNDDGTIKSNVSKKSLEDITNNFMSLLDSSCAIYEKNGDYALGIFSSGWCQYLDKKSRELCNTEDNEEALRSGDWLCHESCWKTSKECMEKNEPVDRECEGGINIYAVPIIVDDEVVGAIDFGYGDPPDDDQELKKITQKYDANFNKLKNLSKKYDHRPEFIIEVSKERIRRSARLLGEMIKNRKMKKRQQLINFSLKHATPEVFWINPEGKFLYTNKTARENLGYSKNEMKELHVWEIDPNHGKDKRKDMWQKLKREKTLNFESKHKTKDGETYPVEIHNHYLKFQGKEYEFAFATDITERKETEKALQEAKQSYEELFEKSGDAIIIHHPDTGEIQDVNNKMCEIYGYSQEEALEQTIMDLSSGEPPYTQERAKKLIQKAKEKGPITFEWQSQKKDGTPFWEEVTLKQAEISGEPKILANIRDITERKKSEEELKEKTEMLEGMLDGIQDIIGFQKPDHTIIRYNQTGYDLLNMTPKEVKGKKCYELIGREKECKKCPTKKALKTKKTETIEKYQPEIDEYLKATATPVLNEEGEVSFIIEQLQKITEQKEIEEREKFLQSILRHDVKNKANITQGYLNLLEETNLSEEQQEFVKKAKKGSEESIDIIEKVKILQEAGSEKELKTVNLNQTLREVINTNQEQAKEKNIEIKSNIDSTCKVQADPLINEMFSNLIENAIKHSKCKKIIISTKQDEDKCITTIEDDGKGIPDKQKTKIFEKGYKKGETGGTGLGLYIVKKITESYGGNIKLKDSELGGAKFKVKLKKAKNSSTKTTTTTN
ncbi:PAS domain S-box protein [Methanonatronarchaeum sp. AMET-Sl]|uniref:PAS domain S-box protein n=1 Tax=Methanonatronarchaeum sp. AMET-Sl TaxID=3037654 RepID=UPI00244DA135|nr:PAS domain S-box protein [Methanonatronarchaeum sp. AMET-Sl]WGI17866.1 PAS domain S-box protein [Methanonatronarchaeum sp. AMET-Sl]